jgi:hypothetical protein
MPQITFFALRSSNIAEAELDALLLFPTKNRPPALALQLRSWKVSESMGNHDSEIVDAGSVD